MAAASDLVNGGVAALQIEEELEEPPEQRNNSAAVLALAPVPWLAAVAERYERR